MTNSLRISYTAFWSYPLRSPSSSQIPLFILCPHFFKFIEYDQCHLSTRWVSGRSLKQGWPCRGHPLAETCFSPDRGSQWSKHKKPGDCKMFNLTWDSDVTPLPLKLDSVNHCRKRTKAVRARGSGWLQHPTLSSHRRAFAWTHSCDAMHVKTRQNPIIGLGGGHVLYFQILKKSTTS